MESEIGKFYAGKSILVTGGTGFIGKVLIEKLLYSCSNLDKIYLLIRGSKGKTSAQRLNEMLEQKPFGIRLAKHSIEDKLVAINCDLSEPDLGISAEDRSLLIDKVSIIFHVAASVKFEAPLEVNIKHNVVATKELLEFACSMKRLESFLHVSTAYSNCQLKYIDERIYPMDVPDDPTTLKVTKEMIDNRPNTYTYTKAMAENVAAAYADRMNVVIVRPSIVMSSLQEPAEGWVDTINGPVGLSVLGALGILQKIKVNSEVVFDLIPVDIVSNALIAIGWASVARKSEFMPGSRCGVRVFNLTSGSENPCSFYQYFSRGREAAYEKPSSRALRPLLTIPKQKGMNPIQYLIYKIFSHLLFAYIMDSILYLLDQKRMVIKAVNRMHHANEVFDYFCSNQWQFVTDNLKKLRDIQSKNDSRIFNCDVRAIDWDCYAHVSWLGCRRFILKEEDSSFAFAKRRYRIICLVYYLVKLILLIASTWLAKLMFISPYAQWTLLLPIYGVVYLL